MKEALEAAERQAREAKIKSRKNKHKTEVSQLTIPVSEEVNDIPVVVGSELKGLKREDEKPKLPIELLERNSDNINMKEMEIIQREDPDEVKNVEEQRKIGKNEDELKLYTRNVITQPSVETLKPHMVEVKVSKCHIVYSYLQCNFFYLLFCENVLLSIYLYF